MFSSSQRIFGPEKYVVTGSPVFSLKRSWPNSCSSRLQSASVRVSCQLIALWTGAPLLRSQITVVSRWLAIPSAHRSAGERSALASATRTTESTFRRISSGSCSTQPGRGKCWRCSCCAIDTIRARLSNTKHLDDAVPWSIDATKRPVMLNPGVLAGSC